MYLAWILIVLDFGLLGLDFLIILVLGILGLDLGYFGVGYLGAGGFRVDFATGII